MAMTEVFNLIDQIRAKQIEAKDLADAGDLDKADEALAEIKNLNVELENLKNKKEEVNEMPNMVEITPVEEKRNAVKEFADAARRGFAVNYANEGTGADGGYTVPEDIQTKINELKEAKYSLENLVTVEKVSTLSGRRTYKTRAQHTGFEKVGEGAKIAKKDKPQFSVVEYKVAKYAGYMPVTNELLADSDANITAFLTQWLADEDVATRNNIILNLVMNEATKKTVKDVDGLKKIINVTLGSAFAPTSKIITNDTGLNYLDTLKDSNGRYLLQPVPNDPMKMSLAVGARAIPVEVIPNDVLPGGENKAPFIIGDLKAGVTLFDRQEITVATSAQASVEGINAFEQDMTIFRGIERLDCKMIDPKAVVVTNIDIPVKIDAGV